MCNRGCAKTEMPYLGHTVSKNVIKVDLTKIEAVACWPKPTNLNESDNFLASPSSVVHWLVFTAYDTVVAVVHAVVIRFCSCQRAAAVTSVVGFCAVIAARAVALLYKSSLVHVL